MLMFAFVEPVTGNVVGVGRCRPHMLVHQQMPGHVVVEVPTNIQAPERYRVLNGVWSPRESEQTPKPRTLTALQFRARFTDAEVGAITLQGHQDAAAGNPFVMMFMQEAAMAQEINLDDARVLAALNMFVALGLLTTQRAEEILA